MCKHTQVSHELDYVNINQQTIPCLCRETNTQPVASRREELWAAVESLGEPFPCRSDREREALSASRLPNSLVCHAVRPA